MTDDEIKDAAHDAFESAMAFGVDRQAFERLARTVLTAANERIRELEEAKIGWDNLNAIQYAAELRLMEEKRQALLQLTAERAVSDRLLETLNNIRWAVSTDSDVDLIAASAIAEVEAMRKEHG